MTTPTPPSGMEILTDYTKPLPIGAVFWFDATQLWNSSEMVGEIPNKFYIYAIPTLPATGDAKPVEQLEELSPEAMKWVSGDTTNEKGGEPCHPLCQKIQSNQGGGNAAVAVPSHDQRQELLPCPFCKSDNAASIESNDEYEEDDFPDHMLYYRVICDASDGGCGSSGGFRKTPYAARKLWNTRK